MLLVLTHTPGAKTLIARCANQTEDILIFKLEDQTKSLRARTMHILRCVVWPQKGLHVHTSRYVQTCTICRSTLHVHTHTRTRTHTPTYGVGFVTLCSNPHQSAPARWAVTILKKTWKNIKKILHFFPIQMTSDSESGTSSEIDMDEVNNWNKLA